ncbi:MAG: hypothetical protein ABJA66_03885 [Actinomycetota bacterium]
MAEKIKYENIGWFLQIFCISIFFILQTSCDEGNNHKPTTLQYSSSCQLVDAKNLLRERLTDQNIQTSESTTDGKSFSLMTDFLPEPRSGRRDKQVRYKVDVKSADNNKSSISFDWDIQSKGIREKKWRDGSDASLKPQYQETISQIIKGICPSGQQ